MLNDVFDIPKGVLLDFLITSLFDYNFPTLSILVTFGFSGVKISHYIIFLPIMEFLRKVRNSKSLGVEGFTPENLVQMKVNYR